MIDESPLEQMAERLAMKEAMRILYFSGRYSYREIASVFGVSHMYVYRAVTVAVPGRPMKE